MNKNEKSIENSETKINQNTGDIIEKLSFENVLIMCKKLYSNGYIDSKDFKSIIDKHGDKTKQVAWTSEREKLLADWAQMSKCNICLHDRATRYYNDRDARLIYALSLIRYITIISLC